MGCNNEYCLIGNHKNISKTLYCCYLNLFLFIANGADRCKTENTHRCTHTQTHTLTWAIIWQNKFFKCKMCQKYYKDSHLVLQIIVYQDRMLHGFEQTQKWIALKMLHLMCYFSALGTGDIFFILFNPHINLA